MSFFTMTRTEAERADPQQRLMLEVAREAFEDAGVTNWRGRTIGTYIGNFGEDWLKMLGRRLSHGGYIVYLAQETLLWPTAYPMSSIYKDLGISLSYIDIETFPD